MKFSRAIGAAMLFATIFATAPPAVAQETPETVVVTATQTPTDLSKIGSSISVIADTDMQRQQTVFATDISRRYPASPSPNPARRGRRRASSCAAPQATTRSF